MDLFLNNLPQNIYKAINEEDKNVLKPLIKKNFQELQELFRLNYEETNRLLIIISQIVLGKNLIKISNLEKSNFLSSGCRGIDTILKGGVSLTGITEIYGHSGAGKTQICLQLCLAVQKVINSHDNQKGAVFICTEDAFPSKRLFQLIRFLPRNLNNLGTTFNLEDNIFIDHIADFEQLMHRLNSKLPVLMNNREIGLIIIDSIAGIFRSENENINYSKRSMEFLQLTSKLIDLSKKHQTAIVCINQITDNPDTGESEPCLGLAWKNLISHRFCISKIDSNLRKFEIIFSPFLKSNECKFIINHNGIVDV